MTAPGFTHTGGGVAHSAGIPDRFDANTRRIIVERGRGWEKARPALLADLFGTSRQHIVSLLKDACATCGEFICSHSDAEWERTPPATSEAGA